MTPVCNCPENIGWYPESSWGLSEASKSDGELIYCVAGIPKIHPHTHFKSNYDRPSLSKNVTGTGYDTFPTSSLTGNVNVTLGGSASSASVTNTQPYPVQLMASYAFTWELKIPYASGSPSTVQHNMYIYVNGSPAATSTWINYGTSEQFTQARGHMISALPTLAAGATMTVSMIHGYDLVYSGSPGGTYLPSYGDYSGYVTLWGGA